MEKNCARNILALAFLMVFLNYSTTVSTPAYDSDLNTNTTIQPFDFGNQGK